MTETTDGYIVNERWTLFHYCLDGGHTDSWEESVDSEIWSEKVDEDSHE